MPGNKNLKRRKGKIVHTDGDELKGVSVEETQLHVGPIPHPDILKGYEDICPGAADRIIAMAEHESEARHEFNRTALNATINDTKRGMWFAALLALVIIISAGYLLATDRYIAGTLFSLPGLAITYKAFLDKSSKEDEDKFGD